MSTGSNTLLFTLVLILSGAAPASPVTATRGFVVTAFAPAVYEGKDSCPDGFADPDPNAILANLPQKERARLLRPENRLRLIKAACEGVAAENIAVVVPVFRTVKGRVSYGLNLDGSDGTTARLNSCPHEDFVSPGGERGIDNQWFRAIGCMKASRPGGVLHEFFNTSLRQGEFTILLEITGLDDAINDNEVQVGFYRGADPVPDANQVIQRRVRMQAHYDRYYHAVTRGRVVDGSLTTDPVDLHFRAPAQMREMLLRDARVKMRLQPGGGLKGVLAGYQELGVLYDAAREAIHWDTTLGPLTCRGFLPTVTAWTDGYPDPQKGGPCSWISVAYEVEAAPVAIVHSKSEEANTAQPSNEPQSWWRKLLWWQR